MYVHICVHAFTYVHSTYAFTQVLHDGIVHLDLSECAVTSEGLGQVWRLCPRLRVVDLSVSHGCRTTLPASGEYVRTVGVQKKVSVLLYQYSVATE